MNDELQDFDLKSEGEEDSFGSGGSGSPRWPWVIAVVVVILGIIAFVWFRRNAAESEPALTSAPAPTVSEPQEADESEARLDLGEIPPLIDSDAWLRQVVTQVSSHPQLAEWLVTPELIRGFVVIVDNIAEGTNPANHLEMAAPQEKFSVRETADGVFVDPASYERFNLLTGVIDSLDTAGTAELYAAILPLCQQAYQDLGYPGDDFEAALREAVHRVLAVPVVEGPIELEPQVTAYEFRDPALEDLSPADKQFLRLGPENLQTVQAKLRAIAQAIGLGS